MIYKPCPSDGLTIAGKSEIVKSDDVVRDPQPEDGDDKEKKREKEEKEKNKNWIFCLLLLLFEVVMSSLKELSIWRRPWGETEIC